MKSCGGLIAALAFVATTAGAQQVTTEAMTSAWQAYKQAVQSRSPEAAATTAREVLKLGEQYFEASDERLAVITLNYGNAALDAGDRATARATLELALQRFEAIHGADSPKLVPVLLQLADASADPAIPDGQAQRYARAINIAEAQEVMSALELANLNMRAGRHLYEMSESTVGRKFLHKAFNLYFAELGSGAEATGDAALLLGKVEFDEHRYRDAEDHFVLALSSFQTQMPAAHDRQLQTRSMLVKTYELLGDSGKATEHCLAIGEMMSATQSPEVEPLFRTSPSYPIDMLANRKEGFVDVGFTVDEEGFVRSPRALVVNGGDSFAEPAIAAVKRFRYAPKFANGRPVETEHVRARVRFEIE